MHNQKDIVLAVDYHAKNIEVRWLNCATGEERRIRIPTTKAGIVRLVDKAVAETSLAGGQVVWIMESTTGWARVKQLVSDRARFVVANVTGSSFWRSLWALPVPLLMALVLAAPLSLPLPHPRVSRPLASLALLTAFVLFVPSFGALSEQNHGPGTPLRLGAPGLKVPPIAYRWASALNDSVPPGSRVLAPHYVSVWVPTFHEHAFPVSVRGAYLREIKRHVGTPRAVLRQVMTDYVGGTSEHEQAAAIFRRGLSELDVKGVMLRSNDRSREARAILREAGFQRTLSAIDHEIWVRS